MPRASVHTLGCRLNQAESALLSDAFRSDGYEMVPESEPADLFIINSCSVTRGAEAKCRRLVRYLLKRSPEAHVVVTGCYAELDAPALAGIDGVDMVVGTEEKHHIPALVESLDKRAVPEIVKPRISRRPFTLPATGRFRETRANLKIQDGCDVFCSFCVIPFTRGRARSRRLGDCLREAENLAARGHREIVVTGVNIGTYRDGGADFTGLLSLLAAVPGVERLRIASVEPMTIEPGVIELMRRDDTICPYMHLCLQSGDDEILAAMKRPYTAAEYVDLFRRLHDTIDNIGIGTDVLVGFPGETDGSFERTYALIESLPFYHFHVFSYSEHARTRSARIADKVHPETAKERSERVRALGRAKRHAFHRAQIGRTLSVLFETQDVDGCWIGHAPNYTRVAVTSGDDLANRIVDVEIAGASVNEATGVVREERGAREARDAQEARAQ